MTKVSVILPTYNESGNIIDLVNAIIQQIPRDYDYEIIVVDDNSPDNTHGLVRETFQANPKVVPVLRTVDRGFAKSIREGIERAGGDRIVVMDTDFTHDPAEIPRLLHVGEVYDIVSGSRFCPGGGTPSCSMTLSMTSCATWSSSSGRGLAESLVSTFASIRMSV